MVALTVATQPRKQNRNEQESEAKQGDDMAVIEPNGQRVNFANADASTEDEESTAADGSNHDVTEKFLAWLDAFLVPQVPGLCQEHQVQVLFLAPFPDQCCILPSLQLDLAATCGCGGIRGQGYVTPADGH